MTRIAIETDGDFSLAAAGEFLRGFVPAAGGAAGADASLSLGFLLDRSFEPVAVHLEQRGRRITGEATGGRPGAVAAQVARMLSLDVDAGGWRALGRRDPVEAPPPRGIAGAALAGRLDADRLRALPEAQALAELAALRGVGAWTAAHILYRGAGLADALPAGEPRVLRAVKEAYRLPRVPGPARVAAIAEGWRPYRMWVAILLVRSIAGTAAWSARGDSARRGRRA